MAWTREAHGGDYAGWGEKRAAIIPQEQYKDIVAYAADRYLTLLTESYWYLAAPMLHFHLIPNLMCNGQAPALYTGTEVGFSTVSVNEEITFNFADDVITKFSEIAPGRGVHVDGNRSHATKKKDFIRTP